MDSLVKKNKITETTIDVGFILGKFLHLQDSRTAAVWEFWSTPLIRGESLFADDVDQKSHTVHVRECRRRRKACFMHIPVEYEGEADT